MEKNFEAKVLDLLQRRAEMKKKDKKIVIECTPKQAMLMEVAMDVMSRICSGQLDQLVYGLTVITKRDFEYNGKVGLSLGMYIEKIIKPILFPELSLNASYGVGTFQLGEDGQVLYEMVKVIQNYRSKDMENPGVLASLPLHYSKQHLIKIREKE